MKKPIRMPGHVVLIAFVVAGILVCSLLILNRRPQPEREVVEHSVPKAGPSYDELEAVKKRAAEAEKDVDTLLAALRQRPESVPNGTTEISTIAQLGAKVGEAKRLASAGQFEEALSLYRRLWERGWIGSSTLSREMLLGGLMSLGSVYPRAKEMLREMRDVARGQAAIDPSNRQGAIDVVLINNRISDGNHTVAFYESLAPDDARRRSIAAIGIAAFVEARMYSALVEAKPFGSMLNEFEGMVRRSGSAEVNSRESIIAATARNIEALIGAGLEEEAATLRRKLTSYDGSQTTAAVIQRHVERARMHGKR